jgi:hypothetical protein
VLNPWEILIVGVLFIAAVVASFVKGENYQETKTEASQKAAVDQAVSEAKANAAIDYGVAQQLALEQQKRELLKTKSQKTLAVAIAADKSAVTCRLADSTLGVLRSSLDAADGINPVSAPSASNPPMPASDPPGRRKPGSAGVRAGLNRVDPLDMQSSAQATH